MPLWLQYCQEFLLGGPQASTGESLLRTALVGCSLFASIQLFTMLGTRWGDHHAMAKSFILSVMVHLCIGLGWATVVELSPRPVEPPGEPTPIPIRQVLLESPDEVSQPDPGNTPIWQKPLDVPQRELARTQRDTAVDPLQNPQRTEVETPRQTLPDVPLLTTTAPETPPAIPAANPAESPALQPRPLEASAVDVSATASRSESAPALMEAGRQALARAADSAELPAVDRQLGGAQRMEATSAEPPRIIPLSRDDQPTLPKPVGPESTSIVRQSSPAAVPIEAATAGSLSPPRDASQPAVGASNFTRSTPIRNAPGAADAPERTEIGRASADLNRERLMAAASRPTLPGVDELPVPGPVRNSPAAAPLANRAQAATTYRLRRIERRREIALRNGGSAESEQAVENALAYLAKVQETDGRWDADRHGGGLKETRQIDAGKPPGGTETDTGLTGLVILAYLGAGYTHEDGEYVATVAKAIEWLIAQQRTDGYLGGAATYYDQMYCHGIATYALAEAYGMQTDPSQYPALREAVTRGCWYIAETQNTDGGWRYRMGASLSDMSMFGWQLMALKSAELAGIATPPATRDGMIQFLRERSRGPSNGLAGYKQDSPPTPAMTAEALFCKQMYGLRHNSPAGIEAVRYLQLNLPRLSQPDEYYWYYGTLAMFQYGGEPWEAWNGALRDNLVRLQRRGGPHSGSWDPVGPWGSIGGRIYSTALSTMCLEVYYRFLPLYQVGGTRESQSP